MPLLGKKKIPLFFLAQIYVKYVVFCLLGAFFCLEQSATLNNSARHVFRLVVFSLVLPIALRHDITTSTRQI
ncbi:MAG: hypothetical protein ACI90V_012656, partial [Bacillariaceae sp.]